MSFKIYNAIKEHANTRTNIVMWLTWKSRYQIQTILFSLLNLL